MPDSIRDGRRLAWPSVAKALVEGTTRGEPVGEALRKLRPTLVEHMERISEERRLLASWGRSWNFDEHARRTIVHPELLAAVAELCGVEAEAESGHAGALHTYAYLLSRIRTPYGFKRTRWLDGRVGRALGLPRQVLTPVPPEGTLLGNLSEVLARLAPGEDGLGTVSEGVVAASLRTWEPPLDPLACIEEGIRLPEFGEARLETRLYRSRRDSESLLLHYLAGPVGDLRSITVFLLSGESGDALLEQPEGEIEELRPRYNARLGRAARGARGPGWRRIRRA